MVTFLMLSQAETITLLCASPRAADGQGPERTMPSSPKRQEANNVRRKQNQTPCEQPCKTRRAFGDPYKDNSHNYESKAVITAIHLNGGD